MQIRKNYTLCCLSLYKNLSHLKNSRYLLITTKKYSKNYQHKLLICFKNLNAEEIKK